MAKNWESSNEYYLFSNIFMPQLKTLSLLLMRQKTRTKFIVYFMLLDITNINKNFQFDVKFLKEAFIDIYKNIYEYTTAK